MPRTFYDGSSVGFFPWTFPVHKLRRGELQFLPGSFLKNVFHKLLEDLKDENEIKDLRENIIISMSCKGAVKAGQKLDMGEMQNMVRRLHEVGKYTCPHGRPIIVKLTKNDLDKMFGRKK